MEGKICVVTGANSGIGKETCIGLARMGAHVVMVCRNPDKGERARADIVKEATGPVDLVLGDLGSIVSVRTLARELTRSYPTIDVLVSNAGVFRLRRKLTADGVEEMFAVNYLAPFLLVNLMLDTLKRSAPSRIVVVASAAHLVVKRFDFDNLQGERRWGVGWQAYGRSKLCNIMFTYALARRLDGTGVTANCLHPGAVATNLGSGNHLPNRIVLKAAQLFILSPAQGAETPIYLASSDEVEGTSGLYFDKKRPVPSSKISYDEDAQERLWSISAKLTGL